VSDIFLDKLIIGN